MIPPPPEVVWWNPWSWQAGTDYSAEIDQQREALNDRAAELYGPEWRAETARNTANGQLDASAEIREEFAPRALAENLGESATAAGKAVGSAVGTVANAAGSFVGRVLLGVPIWLWLIGLTVAFVYLGGPAVVGPILRRRLSK
jgi:hypothetical protein